MTKTAKDQLKKALQVERGAAANNNEQPVVADAMPRPMDNQGLAKSFAPAVHMRATADLKLNPRNARKHSQKQISQLRSAMKVMGFIVPIIIDEGDVVLAGHGRLAAAALA